VLMSLGQLQVEHFERWYMVVQRNLTIKQLPPKTHLTAADELALAFAALK